MAKLSVKLIYNLIKKTIGKGIHKLHEPLFCGNEVEYITNTIKKNFVSSSGEYVDRFEKEVKRFTKAKYAIAVVNGTQAIFIALKVLGVKEGQEVLVPALTFIGTVNAISYTGATPHFVDSSIKDFGIDFKKLDNYLEKISKIEGNQCFNKKTGRIISAIVPVHIFGHPCDLDSLIKLSKKFKFKVVEDSAEALGSFYKKKHVGLFGDLGCLSFNGNKIITTGGGGSVITNKKNLAEKIKHLVSTAKIDHRWEYLHDDIGYNFRMPNINAALGVAQLENIKLFLKSKRILLKNYKKNFLGINGVKVFIEGKNMKSNYWLQTLVLDKRYRNLKNKLLNYCYNKNFFLRPAWKLISEQKPYKKHERMNLSGAKDIYSRTLNLPSSQSLTIKYRKKNV